MAVRALDRPERPQLRVLRGGDRARLPYVKIVLVVVFTVFAVSGLQAYLGQEGLRVAELEERVTEAEERLTLLRAKQAQLSSPGRIAAEAERLGMVSDPQATFLETPVGHPSSDDEAEGNDELRAHKALTAP